MNMQLIALAVIMLVTGAAITFLWLRRSSARLPAAGDTRSVNTIFQTAFENHPAGVGFLNPEGRWLGANTNLTAELGYSRVELLATSLRLLTHPQDRKHESALVGELRAGKRQSYQITKRILRKSGEYGTYRVQMFRCTGEGSSVLQCIIERDDQSTTRLQRVAEALREVPDTAAILFDGAGTISGWNLGAERLFGFSETEMAGRPWASLQPDHAGATANLRLIAAGEHGKSASAAARTRKDGSSIEVSGTILSDMRLGEANEYLEICRSRDASPPITSEESATVAENVELREQVRRAAESDLELRKSIASLRAANSEFARRIGVLTAVVRKTISARNKPQSTVQTATPGIDEGLVPDEILEVSWMSGPGESVYDSVETLVAQARTGTLLLLVGGVESRLMFRNGLLAACSSDDNEHAIGRLLVDAGIINERERRSALEAHTVTSVPMGSSLVEMGLITTNDLENVIRTKALRELADAASREQVQYAFVNRDFSPPGMIPMAIDLLSAMGRVAVASEPEGPVVPAEIAPAQMFVGRAGPRSRVYHDPACATARRIPRKLRVTFDSAAEAEADNFRRCDRCLSS